jgi:DNA repair protein radc
MEKKLTVPPSSLPRERLLLFGEKALSDQELLAIFLRTGVKPYHVTEIAALILAQFPTLHDLKNASLEELQEIKGVGKIRAIELKAIIELGSRIHQASQPKYGKIHSSFGLAQQLIEEFKDYHQEHLVCLYLNTKNEIIFRKTVFIGSLNQSIAHPREIYREAVRRSAARIICTHNHRETRL